MVQKVLSCPRCAAQIEVPDGYFHARIDCAQCGAPVNRLSGQPYVAPSQHQPQAFAQPQAPGYALPPQYAQGYPGGQYMPPQYAWPPPKRGGNRALLIVALVVGGIFLVGAIAGVASVFIDGFGGVDADGDWVHHVSKAGKFEADFPGEPNLNSEPISTPIGSRTFHRAQYIRANVNFEVSYFDFGSHPARMTYDYASGANAIAKESKGRVQKQRPRKLGRYDGMLFNSKLESGRYSTLLLLRRDERVYAVICENHPESMQAAADRLINSFKLISGELEVDAWKVYGTVGNAWTLRAETHLVGDKPSVTTIKHEVVKINGNTVTMRTTTYIAGHPHANEYQIELDSLVMPTGLNITDCSREKLTVAAGEFDCVKTTMKTGDVLSFAWVDRETGLMVRSESRQNGEVISRTDLTEYSIK